MFGLEPSKPAKKSLKLFQEKNINKIVELGAGLGRDTIFFAKNSIHVSALDYSVSGIKIINEKAVSQNLSKNKFQIFHRGKVKIKKEVVPMGIKISKRKTKNHLEPSKWNKLISNKKTILIDARKPFEYKVGTFKGCLLYTSPSPRD